MNKVNHLRSVTCFLLVLFLFAPVLLRSLNALVGHDELRKAGYVKHSAGSSKSDGQFLFEEKEKEGKNSDNDFAGLAPLYTNIDFEQTTRLENQENSFFSTLPLGGKLSLFLIYRDIKL